MSTPDVNVLLDAVNADGPQHAVARDWVEASSRAGHRFQLAGIARLSATGHAQRHLLALDDALGVVDPWLSHLAALAIEHGANWAPSIATSTASPGCASRC